MIRSDDIVRVLCWDRRRQVIRFEPRTGHGSSERIDPGAPALSWGFAHRHRGLWYVVSSAGSEVIFQAGTERHSISDQIGCEFLAGDRRRTFRVRAGARVVCEVHYRLGLLATLAKRFDPTWDRMDEEDADFFLWLAGRWNEFAARARPVGGSIGR
jgi:hypothetical protein